MPIGTPPVDEAEKLAPGSDDQSAGNATEDAMMTDAPLVPDGNVGIDATDVEMTDVPDQFSKTTVAQEGNVQSSALSAVPDSKNASTGASEGVAQVPETAPGESPTEDISSQTVSVNDAAQMIGSEKEASTADTATGAKTCSPPPVEHSAPKTAATPTAPEALLTAEKEMTLEPLAEKDGSTPGKDATSIEKPVVEVQHAPQLTERAPVLAGAEGSGLELTVPVEQAMADAIPAQKHEPGETAMQIEAHASTDSAALAQGTASIENLTSAEKPATSNEPSVEENPSEAEPKSEKHSIAKEASASTESSVPEEKPEPVVPAAQTDEPIPGDQSSHLKGPSSTEKPITAMVPSVAPTEKLETGKPEAAGELTSLTTGKSVAPADKPDEPSTVEPAVEKNSSGAEPESEKLRVSEEEPAPVENSTPEKSAGVVKPAQAEQPTPIDQSSHVERATSADKPTASMEQFVAYTEKLDTGKSETTLATEKSVTPMDKSMSTAENTGVCAEKSIPTSGTVASQENISASAKRPPAVNNAMTPQQSASKTPSPPSTAQATSAAPTASATPTPAVPAVAPTPSSIQRNQQIANVPSAPVSVSVSLPTQPAKATPASLGTRAAHAPVAPTTSEVAQAQKHPRVPPAVSSSASVPAKPVTTPASASSAKNSGAVAVAKKAVPVAPVPRMVRVPMSGISTPIAGATARPSTGGVPPPKRVRVSGTLDAAGSTINGRSNGVDLSEATLQRYRQAAADTGVRLIARASAGVQLSGDRKQMFLDDHARYMREIGAEFKLRTIGGSKLDLFTLYVSVLERGGVQAVISSRTFRLVAKALDLPRSCTSAAYILRSDYEKMLYYYEQKHVWGRDPVQAPPLSVVDRSSRPSAVQPSPQVLRNTQRPVSRTTPRSVQPSHVANSTPTSARPKRQAALAASSAVAAAAAAQADEMYGSPDSTPRRTRTLGIDEMSLTPTEEAIVEEEVNANAPHTVYVPGAQGERERVIGALWSTVHDDVAFALGTLNALSFDPRNTFQARQFTGLLDALYEIMHRHLEDVLGSRSFSLPTGTEQIDPAAPRVVPMPAVDVADAGHLSEGAGIGVYGSAEHDGVLRSSSLQQYGNLFNVVDSVAVDREQCAVVAVNVLRNMSFSDRNAIFLSETQAILELSAEMILTVKVPANLRDGLMDMWINVSPYLNVSKGYPGHVVLTTCIKLLDPFLEGADFSRFTNCGEVLARLAASPERNEDAFVEQFNDLLPRLVDMLGGKDRRYINAGLAALCNCSAFDWPARSRIARVPRAMPRLVQMLTDPELAPRAALTLLNLAEAPSNRSVLLAYEKQLVEQAIKVSPAADTVASVLFDLSND